MWHAIQKLVAVVNLIVPCLGKLVPFLVCVLGGVCVSMERLQPVIKNIVIDSNKMKTGIIFFIVIVFSLIIEFDKLDSDCRVGRLDWPSQQWLAV